MHEYTYQTKDPNKEWQSASDFWEMYTSCVSKFLGKAEGDSSSEAAREFIDRIWELAFSWPRPDADGDGRDE